MQIRETIGFQLWAVHMRHQKNDEIQSFVVWAENEAHAFYKFSTFFHSLEGGSKDEVLVWFEFNKALGRFVELERSTSDSTIVDIEVGTKPKTYIEDKISEEDYHVLNIFPLPVIS